MTHECVIVCGLAAAFAEEAMALGEYANEKDGYRCGPRPTVSWCPGVCLRRPSSDHLIGEGTETRVTHQS